MRRPEKTELTAMLVGVTSIGALVLVGAVVAPAISALVAPPAVEALHLEPPKGKALDRDLLIFDAAAPAPAARPAATEAGPPTAVPEPMPAPSGAGLIAHPLPARHIRARVLAADAAVYGWSGAGGWTAVRMADAGSFAFVGATVADAHGCDTVAGRACD